jgi:hypothetical protein
MGETGVLGGAPGGIGGQMMLPPGGMGGMGGAGRGGQERERLAFLPEDEEYWGTGPGLPEPALGARAHHDVPEPEFGSGPAVMAIGARRALEASADTRSKPRRMS